MCFVILVVSAASVQGKKAVPPPSKPAGDGPSLKVTMKFIQDKLNGIGPVNYAVYAHDDITGISGTGQNKAEVTKVVADPSACLFSYHARAQGTGLETQDRDPEFHLKNVEKIVVMPMDQALKENAAAAGHPSRSFRIDPPVFNLDVRRTDTKGTNDFLFLDEELANRVAKAMVHAVELCGGGSQPEPF
jgi:hypothetical protein